MPIKYMGSKSRIAKHIVPIIQDYINRKKPLLYIEPFVGGANVIDKIKHSHKIGSDINKYLIALLNYVKNGGQLYESVSKELYSKARTAINTGNTSEFKDWELGNIGLLASFNGQWFNGGYAKPVYEKTKNGLRYRDYYREAKDNLLKQSPKLKDISFNVKDYKEYTEIIKDLTTVVYCDPPYDKTKKYLNSRNFNYEEFWDTMREWSKYTMVFISEQKAPDDFIAIWENPVSRSIRTTNKSISVEKLFVYRDNYIDWLCGHGTTYKIKPQKAPSISYEGTGEPLVIDFTEIRGTN